MTDAAAKQQILVDSIAVGVNTKMTPALDALTAQLKQIQELLAKQTVTQNSCLARLETLESSVGAGPAPKRAVRGAGAAAKTAAKKPVGKKAGGGAEKVTNALLYCRYIMEHDIDGARDEYGTEENLLEVEDDSVVSKRDKDKDPEQYWSAVGAALWKIVFSEEKKAEIRAQFNAWKEDSQRDSAEAPLEAA